MGIYPGCTHTRANLAAQAHIHPTPVPSQFPSSSRTCREKGQDGKLYFIDQEGQGLKASLSQRNRPRYSDCLQLELWAPNTVSSPYLALAVCFLNWFWSFGAGATTARMPTYHTLGHLTSWMKAGDLSLCPSHAATSPNCSNTLRTSCNEMLNRSELERQLDFTH